MVSKICGTDSKANYAFVSSCSKFNKNFYTKEYEEGQRLSVQSVGETRIEMMGGGFKELGVGRDGQT